MANNECYTPAWYIDAVVEVFSGRIDLDVASCRQAQEVVKALAYYSEEDDGLLQGWYGNVFCNPPYARVVGAAFAEKAILEYISGNVENMIFLQNSQTSSDWYQDLLGFADAVCWHDKRINFYGPKLRGKNGNDHSSTTFFLGEKVKDFFRVFSQRGKVAVRGVTALELAPQTPSDSYEMKNRLLLQQNLRLSQRVEELSQLKLI